MQRQSKLYSLNVSMWYPFWLIPLKLSTFLLDYKVSFICNFIPFGNIKLALPKPSIKLGESDIVLT